MKIETSNDIKRLALKLNNGKRHGSLQNLARILKLEKLGIDPNMLSAWSNGYRSTPRWVYSELTLYTLSNNITNLDIE